LEFLFGIGLHDLARPWLQNWVLVISGDFFWIFCGKPFQRFAVRVARHGKEPGLIRPRPNAGKIRCALGRIIRIRDHRRGQYRVGGEDARDNRPGG
jgi:hypothetical protein